MNEHDVTKKIKTYLKSVSNCFFWKEHGGQYGTSGIPDLIVCYRGRFIAFEVKAEQGRETVLQKLMIRKIIQAGGYACVVRSVADVKTVIDAFTIER